MEGSYRAVVIGAASSALPCFIIWRNSAGETSAWFERSVLTAGSSWPAAGGVHALNADPNMAALQALHHRSPV